jgi:hypothetical protein
MVSVVCPKEQALKLACLIGKIGTSKLLQAGNAIIRTRQAKEGAEKLVQTAP